MELCFFLVKGIAPMTSQCGPETRRWTMISTLIPSTLDDPSSIFNLWKFSPSTKANSTSTYSKSLPGSQGSQWPHHFSHCGFLRTPVFPCYLVHSASLIPFYFSLLGFSSMRQYQQPLGKFSKESSHQWIDFCWLGERTSRVPIQNAIENEAFPFIHSLISDPDALLNDRTFNCSRNSVWIIHL